MKTTILIFATGISIGLASAAGHIPSVVSTVSAYCITDSADSTSARDELVSTALIYLHCPYKYAACNPDNGFDCSGFVYYIFREQGIAIPRSSAEFRNIKPRVNLKKIMPGDLVLFTSPSSKRKTPGHVGIVSEVDGDEISFIHASTSSGVIVSKLSEAYYQKRFLFAVRIFDKKDK